MILKAFQSDVNGMISIPGSKSHTIRALFFAALADGKSEIRNPLVSSDSNSAVNLCKAFGASYDWDNNCYIAKGVGGNPGIPEDVIDVGNSGTSLRLGMMTAALVQGCTVFTGDYQIRKRQIGPLVQAINSLGGQAFTTRANDSAPVVVKGRASGGFTRLDAVTSQYLSSILINAPLLEKDTHIEVIRLNEVPYVEITLWWMDKFGIKYSHNNMKEFYIPGQQQYSPFKCAIPGDFSSATFFMVLSAISGQELKLTNLDMSDPQGDKKVLSVLEDMGAKVTYHKDEIIVKGEKLQGREIDMNAIPDALPAMAVAACFAEGETRLLNVPQARLKETDRISVMCSELTKMGADIEELPDGLIIRESKLKGCRVNGHDDHRIVMSLAIAGLNSPGETIIDTAEAMNITFPGFVDCIRDCGGRIELLEDEQPA
ncbi:3-phosphoshikimate 1-carboxyvinyltransferase [Ruminiclostridium sufflavum DSM 19573]|uniref:3-phosphoshikimate 1-carboxyvinyltransferase n=1 Tax=Ruminiclostridium sufflavum DSM 19573 TaxID=1121337 RepID=A0A318Y3S3_9FIRM|nr:3-phosphoshikimate 1-carboxyvinyltransferase [Ruminiclostridium sufflavum]PYG86671.1 3-phosphoshikimate 1-carboxyvinyltransferase [Ruminiclostridium sufflavum DSM 19573]